MNVLTVAMNNTLGLVHQVNNVIWKNQDDWLLHSTTSGLVALLAHQYFHFSGSLLIGGSVCLTGGLAFTAFQIGFQLFRQDKSALIKSFGQTLGNQVYKNQPLKIEHILFGAASTAAFAYLAAVPIVTTVALGLLGWVVSKVADYTINNMQGLAGFKVIFHVAAAGARGGIIYAAIQRGIRRFTPTKVMDWRQGMERGSDALLITAVAFFASYYIVDKITKNETLKKVISYAGGIGCSCLYAARYSNIPVITNISIIALGILSTI